MSPVGLFLGLLLAALRLALGRLLGCLLQQFPRLLILLGPARVGPPTLYIVAVARFLDAMMEGTFAQHIPPTLMRASVITLLRTAAVRMATGTCGIIAVAGYRDAVVVGARGSIVARAKGTRKGPIECHQVGTGLTTTLGGTLAAIGPGGGRPTEGGVRKLSIGSVFVGIRMVAVGVSATIAIIIMSVSLSIGNDGRNGGIIVVVGTSGSSTSGVITVWPGKSSPSERRGCERVGGAIHGHRWKIMRAM